MLEFKIKRSNVLKKAVATISYLAKEVLICYSPTGLHLEAVADKDVFAKKIVAILRINVANADKFRCDAIVELGMDSKGFYRALDTVNSDEWSVTVNSDDDADWVTFVFGNPVIGAYKYDEMEPVHASFGEGLGPIEVLAVEYRSVVGIPSLEFIRILTHFLYRGDCRRVHVTVTEARVMFYSNVEMIVLKKKYGQCIIGGVNNPFTISINLGFLSLFLNVAAQTPTVWILDAVKLTDPVMLNIPLGDFLGNLMLYFYETLLYASEAYPPTGVRSVKTDFTTVSGSSFSTSS